jgi:hypothetical protein
MASAVSRLTSHFSRCSALLAGSILACGGHGGPAEPHPENKVTQTLPLDQLYVLEVNGVPPNDTTISFQRGEPRTVILRHGAPDNGVFAELVFPAAMFKPSETGDSVTVVCTVRPGIYGVDVASSVQPDKAGIIRFKYPVHFSAPLGALQKYGTRLRYELALQVGRETDDQKYALYESLRRASDNLEATLVVPGRYLVGAPR